MLAVAEAPQTDSSVSFFSRLKCSVCEEPYSKHEVHTTCKSCGKSLLVDYFIRDFPKELLTGRPANLWRYREMLPVLDSQFIINLGEGFTPLIPVENLARVVGSETLLIKDESLNPTGSFKARGLSMAISRAYELGIKRCVIPTAGNAGGAMAAYCAKAGIEAHVFMPTHTPEVFKKECQYFGAHLELVDGNISDCAKAITERDEDWFNVSTLKEPYRVEGKKTMAYEIVEQMNWQVPEVIIYPTGGGTGLIGMWKAFDEMEELGWIGPERPRMVAVQAENCRPIVDAFSKGRRDSDFYENASTIANGMCVPKAFADHLVLNAIYESKGTAIAISDEEMIQGVKEIAKHEGLFVAPEGGSLLIALKKLLKSQWIKRDERVVIVNTGSGYKYVENL